MHTCTRADFFFGMYQLETRFARNIPGSGKIDQKKITTTATTTLRDVRDVGVGVPYKESYRHVLWGAKAARTVYGGVYHTSGEVRCSELDCSTTKKEGTNTERRVFGKLLARCFQSRTFWHRHYSQLLSRYRAWKIGPLGGL